MNRLTPRETQIVALIAQGLSTKAIADALGTARSTVKAQRYTLYQKLGIGSQAQLIVMVQERADA